MNPMPKSPMNTNCPYLGLATNTRMTPMPRMMMAVNNLGAAGGMWGSVDGDRGMRRLHYPQSEYDNNRENVLGGIQLLGGPDEYSTDVWWAKKQN